MRKKLVEQEGERRRYSALFSRIGKKTNYRGYAEETILLKDVMDLDTRQVVADHIWFSYTKSFQQVSLSEGVRIEFEARVKEYKKGYVNTRYKINSRTTDFKLSHPTRIKVISP